jgi:hypothetical protein
MSFLTVIDVGVIVGVTIGVDGRLIGCPCEGSDSDGYVID